MMEFTQDELIAALMAAAPDDTGENSDARTVKELEAATGLCKNAVLDKLRPLVAAGRVVCVRKPMTRIDGVRVRIACYKFVGGKDGD